MTETIAPPSAVVSGDPVAVIVGLVAAVEPALERAVVEDVVRAVAGGRVKRDRLAHALVEHPQLLMQGRSPAPRAVGELLIALRGAGAVRVAAPVCAGCGKPLRSIYTRGRDWLCWVCGRPREVCAGCGQAHSAAVGDGSGARSSGCPLEVVVDVVAELDPTLPAEIVRVAVRDAVPQPAQRHQLACAVAERPSCSPAPEPRPPCPRSCG